MLSGRQEEHVWERDDRETGSVSGGADDRSMTNVGEVATSGGEGHIRVSQASDTTGQGGSMAVEEDGVVDQTQPTPMVAFETNFIGLIEYRLSYYKTVIKNLSLFFLTIVEFVFFF